MRLFHFCDNPNVEVVVPRPVRVPAKRSPGHEWLNGPLVWGIEEAYQFMYLFPRECPRIPLGRTSETTEEDGQRWWQGSEHKILAFIEEAWLERVSSETVYRYEMPTDLFEEVGDGGMWVSKSAVKPVRLDPLADLRAEHRRHHVELRVLSGLLPLKD